MLFNTWFGQMRPKANAPGQFYYRVKRPIGRIQLKRLEVNGCNTEYRADSRGNMNVAAQEHIRDFVGLGYPIYNGMFIEVIDLPSEPFVSIPQHSFLLWPDNPEYDRRVLEGLSQKKEA